MNYICKMYEQQAINRDNRDEWKTLYPHFACATDTNNIRRVFSDIKDTVLLKSLRDYGVIWGTRGFSTPLFRRWRPKCPFCFSDSFFKSEAKIRPSSILHTSVLPSSSSSPSSRKVENKKCHVCTHLSPSPTPTLSSSSRKHEDV